MQCRNYTVIIRIILKVKVCFSVGMFLRKFYLVNKSPNHFSSPVSSCHHDILSCHYDITTDEISVGFPLNVVGGVAGRKNARTFEAPCRVKNFPRDIPEGPIYRTLPFQMVIAGFLPFRWVTIYNGICNALFYFIFVFFVLRKILDCKISRVFICIFSCGRVATAFFTCAFAAQKHLCGCRKNKNRTKMHLDAILFQNCSINILNYSL